MRRKVILDIDPAMTDVLTLYFALNSPDLEILGITVCGGKTPPRTVIRTIQMMIESLDPPRLPRLGVGSPLTPDLLSPDQETLAFQSFIDMRQPASDFGTLHPAERILAQILQENPKEVTLVTLGPLTNTARAFAREKELPGLLERLVMVGGSICAPGNASPTAELNIFRDPHSARDVLRTHVAKLLVPLDVTNKVLLGYDILKMLPSPESRLGGFLRDLLPRLLYLQRKHWGIEGLQIPGIVALLALTHPEMVRTRAMAADIELHGEFTRGMTVFDRRNLPRWKKNVEVVTDVFVPIIREQVYHFLENIGR